MRRLLPQALRYPLFFIGLMLMVAAGFANRYVPSFTPAYTVATVSVGFIVFLISIVL